MDSERAEKSWIPFRKGLTKAEFGWVMYDWANSGYVMIIMTVIATMFFMEAAQRSGLESAEASAYWALTSTVVMIILGVLAPIIGTLCGYKGKKKKLFVFFAVVGMVATVALSFVPERMWFLMLAVYAVSGIGFSGGNKIYDTFIVDVTENKKMNWLSSLAYGYGYIGGAIPFILCIPLVVLVEMGTLDMDIMLAYRISFVVAVVWWLLFTIPMFKDVKQKYGTEVEPHYVRMSFSRVWSTFKEIATQKHLIIFLVAFFLYSDGVGSIIRLAVAYGETINLGAMTLMMVLLVTQFVAFPFAILYGKLASKYGAKVMIYVGIFTYCVVCLVALFMNPDRDIRTLTIMFWTLGMLVGTAQGGIQALSRSYFGQIIPKEKSNEYFGFYNVFSRFATILGTTIYAVIVLITDQPHIGIAGIALLFIISAVVFKFVPSDKVE
ncbi:MAG: MFS transporter [Defluviitaleaceae bacterium]|nr:MFS transporter [Defluviitaleaceae bacterium]MCL2239940.1 MFS transporter [Defluviitaleaceae bacterium]